MLARQKAKKKKKGDTSRTSSSRARAAYRETPLHNEHADDTHAKGQKKKRKKKKTHQRTILILRLIPRTIAPHILRLLLLMLVSSAIEHLVEEAELRMCAEDPGAKKSEEEIRACHCCGRVVL